MSAGMRMRTLGLASSLVLLLASGAWAVQPPGDTAGADATAPGGTSAAEDPLRREMGAQDAEPELAGSVDPVRYRLGPGDVLSLEFSGRLYRQMSIVVDAEGRINVPEIGVLDAGGLTLAEMRDRVLSRLRKTYTGVRVDLRLVHVRAFKVYVSGQVAAPGPGLANGATRVSELFHGEFALTDAASHRNIELRHRDGRVDRVDLDAFSALGMEASNPMLEDGDVIFVPVRKEHVFALGAFGRPGEFELVPGDSVHLLVRLAQGTLPRTEPGPGLLYRFVSPTEIDSIPVDLVPGLGGADPALKDGDRLFAREVPDYQRVRNVTLNGEFVHPGPYAIREGHDRVADVVARAGGLTAVAASHRILVVRPTTTVAGRRDTEFERLLRLSRSEMTEAEYQTFKTKLASQEAVYVLTIEDLEHPGNAKNVLLRDGDVLAVDRDTPAVRVDGQVREPSLIEYAPGRDVDDYIRLAGGLGARAWTSKIRITRAGLNQTLYVRDAGPLQPGDFIWVPEKNEVSFWSVFKDVLTVAGAAATVVILVRGR